MTILRRKDREVKDINDLLQIIDKCKVCRIATQDKDGLYIVPMNFGYVYEDNQLVLFFHSAKEGRKINAFKENADICFEMDCDHQLITGEEACRFSYSYRSIVGNGRVVFIDDPEEKKYALCMFLLQNMRAMLPDIPHCLKMRPMVLLQTEVYQRLSI